MKKAFLFALAVLCVSAAQAVTITWSTMQGNAVSSDGKYATDSITFNLSQVAGCVTSTIGTNTSAYLQSIVFAGRSEGDANYTVSYAVLEDANGNALGTSTSYTKNTNVNMLVAAASGGYTTYNRTAHTFTFEDIFVNDITANYTLKFYNASDALAKLGYSVVKNSPTNATNVWTPAMTVTLSDTVPEPTALALLALGVAGLALKRKVA